MSYPKVVVVERFVGLAAALAGVAASGSFISPACRQVRFGCYLSTRRASETTFQVTCSRLFERKLKMASRTRSKRVSSGDAPGLELLQSVREMKASQVARVTKIEPNELLQARQATGLSQSPFAEAVSISKRTLQGW